jgi:putative oxidoreductase
MNATPRHITQAELSEDDFSKVLDMKRGPVRSHHATVHRWTPRALALLRIVAGYLFIQHGIAQFSRVPHQALYDNLDVVSVMGLAGVLELAGGFLFLIGLFTRSTAFVLSGFMAVAYFMAHASRGHLLAPMLNQGELAVVYCFVFLYFVVAGPGAWSFDATRERIARYDRLAPRS